MLSSAPNNANRMKIIPRIKNYFAKLAENRKDNKLAKEFMKDFKALEKTNGLIKEASNSTVDKAIALARISNDDGATYEWPEHLNKQFNTLQGDKDRKYNAMLLKYGQQTKKVADALYNHFSRTNARHADVAEAATTLGALIGIGTMFTGSGIMYNSYLQIAGSNPTVGVGLIIIGFLVAVGSLALNEGAGRIPEKLHATYSNAISYAQQLKEYKNPPF